MYKKVYFVKLCPNFVGSPSFHFKIYQRILWNTSLLGKSPSIGFCIPERETPQPVLPYCTMSQKCHYMCHYLGTMYIGTFKNSFTCDYILPFLFFLNKHTIVEETHISNLRAIVRQISKKKLLKN